MKERKKLPLDVETFQRLFVNKEDTYSVQDKSGKGYFRVKRVLDQQTIKDHMLGKRTIGLYQLKNNKIKWALLDIDVNKEVWSRDDFDIDDWTDRIEEQAKMIKEKLNLKDITGYREKSGFKGEHVWIFFEEPVEASSVKNTLDSMFRDMEMVDENMHIEIFPKQSFTHKDNPGSLVKAPLGKHQKSKEFSEFVDPIDDIKFTSKKKIKNAISPFDSILQNCKALKSLKEEALHSEHLTHDARLPFAYIFGNLGEKGLDYVEEEIFSKLNDYDPDKTRYQLLRMVENDYNPITCKKLQEQGICPGQCSAIGDNRSPIAFYYRQKGISTKKDTFTAINRMDNYMAKNNRYYWTAGDSDVPELLSNFTVNLYEQVHIDDGIEEKTVFKGVVVDDEGEHEIEVDAEDFASNERFTASLYKVMGNSGTFVGDIRKIREASNKYSNQNKIMIKKTFGWNEDHTKYYTPSCIITPDRIKPNDEVKISLEGEGVAEHLDMVHVDKEKFQELQDHIKNVLLKLNQMEITHTAFAHALSPAIEPFIDSTDNSKYIYFLRGASGTGKSFLLKALQNLYGSFPDEVVTWSSTPYAIQRLGYFFKDAMYLVDDFKNDAIGGNYRQAKEIMQNYADNTARARLKSSGQAMAQSYVIKGYFTSTGEDVIENEASNIGRMIVIHMPNGKRDITAGHKVNDMKSEYKGFTPYYIRYALKQDRDKIKELYQGYLNDFFKEIRGASNDIRIAANHATLMVSVYFMEHFMFEEKKAEENIEKIKEFLTKNVKSAIWDVNKEKSSTRFWNYLKMHLSSNKLRIVPAPETESVDMGRGTIVGFENNGQTWLMHQAAFDEIQKVLKFSGRPLTHSLTTIINDLADEGVIDDPKPVSKRFNGKDVKVIPINLDMKDEDF